MKSLALVIPCKDEALRLVPGIFFDAVKTYPFLTLLFVDDGSTDDTAEVLALMERESPAIRALYLPANQGKAGAVRAGVRWLLAHTDAEAIGFWDADLATPFSELPGFVRALEEPPREGRSVCAAVLGSRWPHLGAQINRSSFRNLTGHAMKLLIRFGLHLPVYDTQCGAKVFRRALAERIFARPFLSRWLFDVELLKRIPRIELEMSVTELPLSFWRDVKGSKVRLRDTLRQLYDIMRIRLCTY